MQRSCNRAGPPNPATGAGVADPGDPKRLRSLTCGSAAFVLVLYAAGGARSAAAADLPAKAPAVQTQAAYDWTGDYVGGHLGYAWGKSDWSAGPNVAGSFSLMQPVDVFAEGGSFFGGLQVGYDKMFANRFVIGVAADISFPSWPNLAGISIGGTSNLVLPPGPDSYGETVLSFGTLRGRVGYAPSNWLFYATGGVAWDYDRLSLASATETPERLRLGWAAGVGAEVPIADHWTASLEYLYTDFNQSTVSFASVGQQFTSGFTMQELRLGLNYRFNDNTSVAKSTPSATAADWISIHGQGTFVWQGYPAIRSPYAGTNSLPEQAPATRPST